MALWDGLSSNPETTTACGNSLKDTSTKLSEQKSIKWDDTISTVTANSNCNNSLDGLNSMRLSLSDYLNIEKANLETIVTGLDDFDHEEGNSYGNQISK